eukprot:SAG31_NODE_343_length_17426_cov_35.294443_17_plen_135_part_00
MIDPGSFSFGATYPLMEPKSRRNWPYRVTLSRLVPGFSVRTWEIQREKSHKNRENSSPYHIVVPVHWHRERVANVQPPQRGAHPVKDLRRRSAAASSFRGHVAAPFADLGRRGERVLAELVQLHLKKEKLDKIR